MTDDDRADVLLLRLNLVFLLFVAFLPFPTKLVADALYEQETDAERLAVVVVGYTVPIALGILVPPAAVALCFALAIFLVVPFKELGQVLSGT